MRMALILGIHKSQGDEGILQNAGEETHHRHFYDCSEFYEM